MDHGGAEGAQSQGGADWLTGRGGVMALESCGDARGSISQSLAGGEETQGGGGELVLVFGEDGAEELYTTSGAGESWGLDGASGERDSGVGR